MPATNYTPVQLYRSGTAAAVPVAGNLTFGELALNYADEKIYFKNAAGAVVQIKSAYATLAGTVSDGAITTVKLADGALAATTPGRAKMADSFVTAAKLATTGTPSGNTVLKGDMSWGAVSAATGGGSDSIFILNGQTVNSDYAIPSGSNAGSFGPVTIATGVTVTVPTGSVWTIV